jgi:hypothetical protein
MPTCKLADLMWLEQVQADLKVYWTWSLLKTPGFIEAGEFQTPFLGKASPMLRMTLRKARN